MPPAPLGTKKFAEVLSVQKCESYPCSLDFCWNQHIMTHSVGTHEIRGKALCPLLLAGAGTMGHTATAVNPSEGGSPGRGGETAEPQAAAPIAGRPHCLAHIHVGGMHTHLPFHPTARLSSCAFRPTCSEPSCHIGL